MVVEKKRRSGKSMQQGPPGEEAVRSLFSKFGHILEMNNQSLGLMADLERALSGEYIFDRHFLEQSVRKLSSLVHQVVYSINAMTRNRFPALLDRYQKIQDTLMDILEGGLGPQSHLLTVALSDIDWETEPLVGLEPTCLAEVHRRTGVAVPEGFVITVTGVNHLMAFPGIRDSELFQNETSSQPMDPIPNNFPEVTILQSNMRALTMEVASRVFAKTREPALNVRAVQAGVSNGQDPLASSSTREAVSPEHVWDACLDVIADLSRRLHDDHREGLCQAAILISLVDKSDLTGCVQTLDPTRQAEGLVRVEVGSGSMEGENNNTETYWLKRVEPYDLVESVINPKGGAWSPFMHQDHDELQPGSGLAPLKILKSTVEAALIIDRMVGRPLNVKWTWSRENTLTLLGFNPIESFRNDEELAEAAYRETETAETVFSGGETAQFGVAAGRVIVVDEEDDPNLFPLGAVAVAHRASPKFSPILRRAAAFISEIGSATGHLATVAREYRVPTIVGAAGVLTVLPVHESVTVDAEERIIYRGVVEALLRYRVEGREFSPNDPEYILLRRLLRWITPLHLIDPESSQFSADSCRTLHDLLHFVHERAVEELIDIQSRHPGIQSLKSRPLKLDIPLDIRVLDIAGGLTTTAGENVVIKDIICRPLQAFLKGLDIRSMWNREPIPIRLRDIIGSLDRTQALLTSGPSFTGKNLAIITRNYLNLSLRLGYHFSVIDAHLGESNRNAVYFRFVGGMADARRRSRRAEFVKLVLELMNFRVSVKGDLVVGKLKETEVRTTENILTHIGELTAFTRQLDVSMASDNDIEDFFRLFVDRIRE